MMVRILLVLVGSLWVGTASAQTSSAATQSAPAAGSAGGRAVGASTASPTQPLGKTPPGAPSVAHNVIGHVATTGTIPGNTGGASTGTK